MAALALPGILRAGEGKNLPVRGLPPLPAKLCGNMTAIVLLPERDHGPGVIPGQNGLVNRQFAGEQVQKTLLHGIALIMALQQQLHEISSAWRR